MASVALSRANNIENVPQQQQQQIDPIMKTTATASSCNGSSAVQSDQKLNQEQNQQQLEAPRPSSYSYYAPTSSTSSSSRGEYVIAPGEDDSRRPLLPKSSSSHRIPSKSKEPFILKDMTELHQHLELMHDRCIARNLRSAGLGGFDVEEEDIYGNLDANAHLATGESMLMAAILYLKQHDRLHHYVAILLNDGANVNEQDPDGKTALMHAIAEKKYKAAKALMRHVQTDLFLQDNEGNTALMYATSVGLEAAVYYFFKALRKRERRYIQNQRQRAAQQDSCTSDKAGNAESSSTTTANADKKHKSAEEDAGGAGGGDDEMADSLSILRSDDPIDMKNNRGETAYALALKNKHVVCANLISDEKVKRARDMTKRLNAITHQRATGSPSIIRLAKRSAKRYFQHYGSFDSLYFDREDESDDELMLTASYMHRSRTADAGFNKQEEEQGPGLGPMKTADASSLQYQPRHSITQTAPQQHVNQKRGLLVRLNKRFQSNPDIFRCKASSASSCVQTPPPDKATIAAANTTTRNEDATTAIRDGVVNEKPSVAAASNQPDTGPSKALMARKSICSGISKSMEKAPDPIPQTHQPIIKRSSADTQPNRRPPAGPSANPTNKRNLTDKLMTFLRIRPKHATDGGPDSAGYSKQQQRGYARVSKKTKDERRPQNFHSIDQQDADPERAADGGSNGSMRKGDSQPNIHPTIINTSNAATSLARSRRRNSKAYQIPENTTSGVAKRSDMLKPRLSLDSSAASSSSMNPYQEGRPSLAKPPTVRQQQQQQGHVASPMATAAAVRPVGEQDEDAADPSMISFTPSPDALFDAKPTAGFSFPLPR